MDLFDLLLGGNYILKISENKFANVKAVFINDYYFFKRKYN